MVEELVNGIVTDCKRSSFSEDWDYGRDLHGCERIAPRPLGELSYTDEETERDLDEDKLREDIWNMSLRDIP